MPTLEMIPGTRRERQANWGQPFAVSGAQKAPLVDVDQEQATNFLVTVQVARLSIPQGLEGDIRPYARIEWGHGTIDTSQDFEVTRRQRIAVTGSKVRVVGFLKSMPLALSNGTAAVLSPIPSTCTAQFVGFASVDTDAQPLSPTYWLLQMGTYQGNLVGPLGLAPPAIQIGQQVRLVTLRGFVILTGEAGPTQVFLQLFDLPFVPVAGELPVDCFPLVADSSSTPATPVQSIAPDNYKFTHAFTQGLAWGVSSTPFFYTPITTAEAFVKVELLH
jgi:hypothetical protein